MHRLKMALVIIFAILYLSACSTTVTNIPVQSGDAPSKADPGEIPGPDPKTAALSVKANESGKIMVLMYHIIGAPQEASWVQTTDNFRRDLETLYEQGYSLISLGDFISNNIKTPPGRTPLVLTFDDGSPGHFRYLISEEGQKMIDPDSAVGILLDFAKKHPEFGHTATFYVNDRPFGQKEFWQEKLRHLVELGFEIGNHTLTHPKLSKVSDDTVQKELAGLAKMVEGAVPGYKVQSLALPHGLSPENNNLAVKGAYADFSYEHRAVLRVGANPALSPVAKGFDPLRLPRVQASTVELTKWLKHFEKRPEERYISDGNPDVVAIPQGKEALIENERIADKMLVIY